MAAGLAHRAAHPAADVGEQDGVAVAEAMQQVGRALDVGEQEGEVALRQLALRLQLGADEADRHDPVLLGRPQQPVARAVARVVVLERHLAEAGERVPDVCRVVDRQAASAARVDVCEGAVGQLRTLLRAKRWHVRHDRKTDDSRF